MKHDIKLVAVDIDGTFVRSDYTYDVPRFQRILARMKRAGCHFVVASGNQYYQLRDLFPGCDQELSLRGRKRRLCQSRNVRSIGGTAYETKHRRRSGGKSYLQSPDL